MNPATPTRLAPAVLESLPPYAPTTYVDFTQRPALSHAHRAE